MDDLRLRNPDVAQVAGFPHGTPRTPGLGLNKLMWAFRE